jgi:hypothetical protein
MADYFYYDLFKLYKVQPLQKTVKRESFRLQHFYKTLLKPLSKNDGGKHEQNG